MERIGNFGGKADQLNSYWVQTGNPDWFNEDLNRYLSLQPNDVQAAVLRRTREKLEQIEARLRELETAG